MYKNMDCLKLVDRIWEISSRQIKFDTHERAHEFSNISTSMHIVLPALIFGSFFNSPHLDVDLLMLTKIGCGNNSIEC